MPSFTCPSCNEYAEIEIEKLPERACDDMDYECGNCMQEMTIGWVAEVDVRTVTVEAGELLQ